MKQRSSPAATSSGRAGAGPSSSGTPGKRTRTESLQLKRASGFVESLLSGPVAAKAPGAPSKDAPPAPGSLPFLDVMSAAAAGQGEQGVPGDVERSGTRPARGEPPRRAFWLDELDAPRPRG